VVFVSTITKCHPERFLFSAHGVSPEIRRMPEERQLRIVDATCPLVTRSPGSDSIRKTELSNFAHWPQGA